MVGALNLSHLVDIFHPRVIQHTTCHSFFIQLLWLSTSNDPWFSRSGSLSIGLVFQRVEFKLHWYPSHFPFPHSTFPFFPLVDWWLHNPGLIQLLKTLLIQGKSLVLKKGCCPCSPPPPLPHSFLLPGILWKNNEFKQKGTAIAKVNNCSFSGYCHSRVAVKPS